MWGTSSSDDKLADDLGNTIEGTRISGRRSDFFTAGKLAPGNLGLLQQYLPIADASRCSTATLSESASAVLRLITSLNSVGCSIGRLPGLAPLKILSTKVAARWKKSAKSSP